MEPFFEDRHEVDRAERLVILPVVCLAIRRRGTLMGLHPCWNDRRNEDVETGLVALEAGTDVEDLF